jgi:putative oxidoreductase
MKKIFSTKYSAGAITLSLLLLRISLGGLMIPHGYTKLINFATKAAGFSDPFHISGQASMSLVIFAELFCASLVFIGLMTRLATIPVIICMSVALFHAHHGDFFGSGEKATLFLVGYLVLLIAGPGKISMDRLIGK